MSRRNSGLSLLEVLISLSLFATALLMVFGFFPDAKRSSVLAKNVATANNLAKEFLERERALPYAAVGLTTGAAVSPPEVVEVASILGGESVTTPFEVTITVEEVTPDRLKDILVSVTWQAGRIERKVELEAYKAKYSSLGGP